MQMTLRIKNICSKSLLFVWIPLFSSVHNFLFVYTKRRSLVGIVESLNGMFFFNKKKEHVQCLTWELWNPVYLNWLNRWVKKKMKKKWTHDAQWWKNKAMKCAERFVCDREWISWHNQKKLGEKKSSDEI